jgi:outer membrane protein TolC
MVVPTPTPGVTPSLEPEAVENLDQPLAPPAGPVPTPQETASPIPAASPTPAASPGASPSPTPLSLPTTDATVGTPLTLPAESVQALPTPTPDALETTLSPQALGLPNVLTDEPAIPADLLSPIPRPPTVQDGNTVKASEETLQKLRQAAKSKEPPPADRKLTLEEAVQVALNNNPDVLRAVEQIRLTQGELISVRAQALPQLAVTSSYQLLEQSLVGPGSPAPQNRFWKMQVGVNQLLFDSGATINAIQGARFVENASYFQLRQTIDQTISNVKINFFQIILNRALIIAQEQSVALLESQLQDQINRFEAGTVPRFNVLQAEVALANSIPPLIQARNNLRISQFQLVRLLGMNYDQANPAQVPFDVVGDLDFVFREIDTDESIRTALIRNPQLKAQRQDILAQAANVNVQLAGYGPRVSVSGGYELQNDPTTRDLTETLEGWFFGLTGSWNIFDGFLTAGNVQQAKARLWQSKILYDDTVRKVILTVQEAISNLQEARETIDSQQASVEQATEALRLSRERLDAGAGTQLDVLNAQVSLLQAQTTLLQARYSYIEALAQYDAALSLDTEWEEAFEDPLARPEKRRFIQINAPDRPQPKLPRVFRQDDPLSEILENPALQATPTPSPTPARASR